MFAVSLTGADISKRKDGGITISTLLKGEGGETPNDGAVCEGNIKLQNLCHFAE